MTTSLRDHVSALYCLPSGSYIHFEYPTHGTGELRKVTGFVTRRGVSAENGPFVTMLDAQREGKFRSFNDDKMVNMRHVKPTFLRRLIDRVLA